MKFPEDVYFSCIQNLSNWHTLFVCLFVYIYIYIYIYKRFELEIRKTVLNT